MVATNKRRSRKNKKGEEVGGREERIEYENQYLNDGIKRRGEKENRNGRGYIY